MASPHPALFELAAGRPMPSPDDPAALVQSAIEHRLAGLLWSRVAADEVDLEGPVKAELRRAEMGGWARNRMLTQAVVEIAAVARQMGIEVVAMKGVAAEARWYDRAGERPSFDIDLAVPPGAHERIAELVAQLQPTHSLLGSLGGLVERGWLQSVDLGYRGLPVDLHTDPLKLELIGLRHPEALFERTELVNLVERSHVRAFDAEASLIQLLLHLNKDRFRYLLGFADVAHVLQRTKLDWDFVERFLDGEGLRTPAALALSTVLETLRIDGKADLHPKLGLGARLWRIAWPEDVRLRGEEGRVRFRYRQFLIPFTGTGHWGEASIGWLRRLVPPPALLDHYYPDVRGPYLWKVVAGRIQRRLQRLRARRAVREGARPRRTIRAVGQPMVAFGTALPMISVVTPSYQHGRYLEATLRSVLDQGYPSLEYLVMDGGSTDGSVEVIRRYADRLAYWTSGPDGGQTAALIEGFKRATGEILCWLNSDDLFEPNTLWQVGSFFRDHPEVRAVYGDGIWVDAVGRPIRSKREHPFNRFIFMYDHDFIPQPSMFWRRDLYDEVGGLDPSFDLAMDADLFIRFADITPLRHIRSPWSRMRLYPEQKGQRLRAKSRAEGAVIRRRYLKPQPRLIYLMKRRMARVFRISWKLVTGRYF